MTVPLVASSNTNLDNGLTSTNWGVEQYTISLSFYAATQDLNMVTSRVGIAAQFLQNAATNGEQAAHVVWMSWRGNALFAPYFGGNTRVITTLGAAGSSIEVDDIRGFQTAFSNGVQQARVIVLSADGDCGFRSLYACWCNTGCNKCLDCAKWHLWAATFFLEM